MSEIHQVPEQTQVTGINVTDEAASFPDKEMEDSVWHYQSSEYVLPAEIGKVKRRRLKLYKKLASSIKKCYWYEYDWFIQSYLLKYFIFPMQHNFTCALSIVSSNPLRAF